MKYELDPKVFKTLSKPEKKFFSNQKNLQAIWSPEAIERDELVALANTYKTFGILPKNYKSEDMFSSDPISQYKINPKSLKGLPKRDKEFFENPKNVKAVYGPIAIEKDKLTAITTVAKSVGDLPKDFHVDI